MILDGVAGALAANTIVKTSVGISGLTALLTWLVWAIFIFVIGVKIFPDKDRKIPFKRVLIAVGYAHAPGLIRFFAVTPELVLLIIFMVTAPLLTVGVQVDLPESAADSLPDDQEPLTISINSKGELYIQEHKVTFQKLIPKLLAIAKNRTDTRIYVRGDKTINYGRVLEVMGTLSGAGFSKVALISEPYKN